MHLLADWELATAVGALDNIDLTRRLNACADTLREALEEDASEHLISSPSKGSSLAVQALGIVMEENSAVLESKRLAFMTLGGAMLQCALFMQAGMLRQRVGMIARAPQVSWLQVRCLTDVIHFYKCPAVALCGHPDAPQAGLMFIRLKQLLSPAR